MKNGPIKPGQTWQITALDHFQTQGDNLEQEPLKVAVTGIVLKVEKTHLLIATWIETNGQVDQNTEIYGIVRSAIVKQRRLR